MVKVLLSALRWAGVFGLYLDTGGGKAPKNTTQTVINDVAKWAQPAAKETLAKGMELTNQGYEVYGGDRLAGFDPMQEQSYQGALDMTTSPQLDEATRLATESGNYNPADFQNQYQQVGESWNPDAAQQYMSPYMEAALNPQLRAATQDARLAQMQDQAAAVGRGAFGGSRTAIGQGMREQGLMQNLGDIRAKGYQTAYEQASQQFQADQARKVQESQLRAQYGLSADQAREASRQFGSTAGLNAAAQLNALGQTQFLQNMDINKLRNTYGTQKQAQDQRAKDLAYENWANEKNWDWEQIMRRADLLNKTPTGSSTTTSMYRTGPSTAQNVAAAGTAAAGASQLFARGGLAYAGGGVTDEQHVKGDIIPSLSTDDLLKAKTIAEQIGDIGRVQAITEELQSRGVPVGGGATEQPIPPNSISAMANPEMVDNIMPTQASMANGGIVAFAGGGDAEDETRYAQLDYPGMPNESRAAFLGAMQALEEEKGLKAPKGLSPEEYRTAVKANFDEYQTMAGESPYTAMRGKLKDREAKIEGQGKKGLGLSLLKAAGNLLQGPDLASGISKALPEFAESYGQSMKESSRQQEAIDSMNFHIADAERKERMGDLAGARASVDAARKAQLEADKEARAILQGRATGYTNLGKAVAPRRAVGGAGSQVKVAEQLAAAEIAYKKNPSPENLQIVEALRTTMDRMKTTDVGTNKLTAGVEKDIAAEVQDYVWTREGRKDMQARMAKGKTASQATQDIINERLESRRVEPALLPKPGTAENPIPLAPKKS